MLGGQRQEAGDGVLRQLDDAVLASLGHVALQGDGAFAQVNPVPGDTGGLGRAEPGEQQKDGVGQEQAVL